MISYERLWNTMKERGISQYDLYEHYNFNRSIIHRLRHNMNIEINTLDRLCSILDCRIEDIAEYFPDSRSKENDTVCSEKEA